MKSVMKMSILIIKTLINVIIIIIISITQTGGKGKEQSQYRYRGLRNEKDSYTKTVCMDMSQTLRARHKACFLRPDTGPCRADIIQWYFDVKQKQCYRFFWGGCQGNGNRFERKHECMSYCFLNLSLQYNTIPHFCNLAFDFGTCFGTYYRWAWDQFSKTCKRRLYSGCGGNQNNFESRGECMKTCLTAPNITMARTEQTTCFPIDVAALRDS